MKILIFIVALTLLMYGFLKIRQYKSFKVKYPDETLTITSTDFNVHENMPVMFTGYGDNISPSLTIETPLAPHADSLVFMMDDIDHPAGIYNHWLLFNVPKDFTQLPKAVERKSHVLSLGSALQGRSDYFSRNYYQGPKPPFGTHEYTFRVFVLDTMLTLGTDTNKKQLLDAMTPHVLQYGTLTVSFNRKHMSH